MAGRRAGKTTLGLLATIEGHGRARPGILEGGRIWWVAPDYPTIAASEIWETLKRCLHDVQVDKREDVRTIWVPGGGSISVRSAEHYDSLRGAGLDGVVFDEAAHAAEETWTQALRPTLADRQGWALFLSTPNGVNWFYRLYEAAAHEPDWARWQLPTTANPRIPPEEIETARRAMGSFAFRQEHLAEFVEPGGGLCKRQWFRYFRAEDAEETAWRLDGGRIVLASTCRRFATVDLAVSTKQTADYTCVAIWALTPDHDLLLLDLVRQRLEGPDQVPLLRRLNDRWRPGWIAIERTAYQLALIQAARRDGLPVRELQADRDKVARALPLFARIEGGGVYFRAAAPWLGPLEWELLAFPEGEHDDQVDACAYAVQAIMARRPGDYGVTL